jgi:outer membrane protein assembly factor BamB
MKITIAILLFLFLACGDSISAAEQPSVKDAISGTSVSVQADSHTLIAVDKDGKTVWKVDVIKAAGAPAVGQPVVRHLSLKDGNVRAIYGKHSFADFDLATGKLVASGSD